MEKRKLILDGSTPILRLEVTVYAGIEDNAAPLPAEELKDAGCVSGATLLEAGERLTEQILSLHEKCKEIGFDVFGASELLRKYSFAKYEEQKQGLAKRLTLQISVTFHGVR